MERVVSVKPLESHLLELEFADGFRKTIDIRSYIREGISSALRDPAYFRKVKVEAGGGIAWENGYDFCPNFLRDHIPAVNRA